MASDLEAAQQEESYLQVPTTVSRLCRPPPEASLPLILMLICVSPVSVSPMSEEHDVAAGPSKHRVNSVVG
jgi:hypothetical protein